MAGVAGRDGGWRAGLRRPGRATAGLLAVSALSVASSAAGFGFQVVLAARFGAGPAIDGYLFAISVPTFLAGLGAAALSYLAVPALVQVETDPDARARLLRTLLRWVLAAAVGFALLGLPAAFVQRVSVPETAALHAVTQLPVLIALGWTVSGVQFLGSLFVVELNARRRPVLAALLALPPNLGAIPVLLLAPRTIIAAPLAVLAGSALATIAGLLLTRPAFRVPTVDAARGTASLSARAAGRVGWTLMAMSCFSAYAVIDAFWGPRAGAGTLASLGYAQRLVIGIGGLILAGPSAILTPRFAARLRDSGGDAFLREVGRTVLAVALLAVAAAACLAALAGPIITVAFARGAFGPDDATRVATVFRAMLPGFCAMLVSVVLTRAIFCLREVERAMAALGLGWSAAYFLGCALLLGRGGVGFGLSYSLAWSAYLIVATATLRRYARQA